MDFRSRYRRECLLSGTSPLHAVEASLSQGAVDFKFFRIPSMEWTPMLSALCSDTTLKQISVRIDYGDYTVSNPMHQQKLKHLNQLCENLGLHLARNSSLSKLQLIGLPLTLKDIKALAHGIRSNTSLEHLSLAQCKVGDDGAAIICEAVQVKPNIVWLDLSSCKITSKCGEALYQLVHHQTVSRENAVWKASLREGQLSMDLMGGIRRLTLNDNDLGDSVTRLITALYEDKWIKVVDVQFCHMTDYHLNGLLQAAGKNQSLEWVDVRNNPNLSPVLVEKLNEVVKINALNNNSSFRFHPIEFPQPQTNRIPTASAKLTSPAIKARKTATKKVRSDKKLAASVPWRVAARLNRSSGVESPKKCEAAPDPPMKEQKEVRNEAEELVRERQMRLDAERQVIRIYAELEAAWARNGKLEKKLKHMKQKRTSAAFRGHGLVSDPSRLISDPQMGIWVDPPTLEGFQMCLCQLRGILGELKNKSTSAPSQPAARHDGRTEAETIMETLQIAIRELTGRINPPDNHRQPPAAELPPWTGKALNVPSRPERLDQIAPPTIPLVKSTKSSTRPSKQPSPRENIPAPAMSSATFKKVAQTPDAGAVNMGAQQRNHLTSTPLSDAPVPKLTPRLLSSQSPSAPLIVSDKIPSDVSSSIRLSGSRSSHAFGKENQVNTAPRVDSLVTSQAVEKKTSRSKESSISEDRINSAGRLSSLKSLQGNLEEMLQQFRLKEDPSINMSRMQNTLVSMDSMRSERPAANRKSPDDQYSMDFDSTGTSIRSISIKSKHSNGSRPASAAALAPVPAAPVMFAGGPSKSRKNANQSNHSKSSSTLNMSSIVDLLGDFSLADIGSSTLTPP